MYTLAPGYEQHEVKIVPMRMVCHVELTHMLLQQLDIKKGTLAAFVPESLDVINR